MREDLSDGTDEDTGPAQAPPPTRPPAPAFRVKDDLDLFGLGLEEPGQKASSSEGSQGRGLPGCQPGPCLIPACLSLTQGFPALWAGNWLWVPRSLSPAGSCLVLMTSQTPECHTGGL